MTVGPADGAGVADVVAVCPAPDPKLLVAAGMLGVERIARIGGAQAIAALAYGTKSVPRVDKIFGPGNKYVTAAKQLVSNKCAIDLPAGPTEAVVFGERGNPRWIAADLLAQAEHAKDAASFFITTSRSLACEVQREIQSQLADLPESMAHCSTRVSGAILVAESANQACEFINRFAPEHLSLPEQPGKLLSKIRASGTVFLGPWRSEEHTSELQSRLHRSFPRRRSSDLEIQSQLADLPESMAHCSTRVSGAILVAESANQACEFINRFAPEHLSLPEQPGKLLPKIRASGTVFLGPW